MQDWKTGLRFRYAAGSNLPRKLELVLVFAATGLAHELDMGEQALKRCCRRLLAHGGHCDGENAAEF